MEKCNNDHVNKNYTLEKHLKNMCDENYQYIDLLATWEIDKKIYKNMLQGVAYNFPHYSMHESSHSKSIISKIEMVLGTDRIKLLGATETWMILETSYLHDFGMILKNKDVEKIWGGDEFQDFIKDIANGTDGDLKEAAEYILNFKKLINEGKANKNWPIRVRKFAVEIIAAYFRGKHAEKSKNYINDFDNAWGVDLTHGGLIKSRLLRLIGDIAFLHGQDFNSVMNLEYIADGLKADYIYPRFIAEMIRLGDLLDLDNGRFNESFIENFGELPKLSKYHLGKHGAITHMLVSSQKIDVSADCKNDGEIRETRKWFEWLEDEVNRLTINWRSIVPEDFTGTAPQIGELKILKNGCSIDRKIGTLKLNMSRKRTFEILEGSGIYKNKLDFLRELIQNALDASKIQLWRDLRSGIYNPWIKNKNIDLKDLTPFDIDEDIYSNYKIIVQVDYIEEERVRITVKDNGIGINEESLFNMANVGESWNRREKFKKELRDMPSWLKPTGGFGIGIQSCFMVSDEINIKTKTYNNDNGIKIKIESGKEEGYITCEVDNKINFNRGSEIVVDVDEGLEIKYTFPGYVYEKMKSYDSFEDENKFFLWAITQYIDEEFENPLFELELVHKNKIEKNYRSIIKNYNEMLSRENFKSENNYLFRFDDNNLNIVYLWDKQYSTSINITLLPIKEYGSSLNQIYFKGVKVNTLSRFWIDVCNISCNINGMDTAEVLTLNREEIRKETEYIIFNMMNEAVKFVAEKYKEKMRNNNFIVEKDINVLTLKILYDIYNINNDTINTKLIDNCSDKIQVLENNNGEFNQSSVKVKQVFKANEIILIDTSEINSMGSNEFIYNIHSIIDFKDLNCYKYILIGRRLVDVIKNYYQLNRSYKIKSIDSKVIQYINIYNYNLSMNETDCVIKLDNGLRADFLGKLADQSFERRAIVLLEGYENLAVKKLPYEFVKERFTKLSNSYAIISPIKKEDNDKIKEGTTKDLIKNEIKGRKDFNNLVNYVFENRADINQASKEEIIQDYMKLIDEYYELIQNVDK